MRRLACLCTGTAASVYLQQASKLLSNPNPRCTRPRVRTFPSVNKKAAKSPYTSDALCTSTTAPHGLTSPKIQTMSNYNSDTTGALASTLIASATTRVRCLHNMTQSDMQAIRSCMYSYMNACMYVHLQHHVYEDHGSYKQAVFIQVSSPADVEAMRFAPGT